MINYFTSAFSPKVVKEYDIYEVLEMIKKPNKEVKEKIILARSIYYPEDKEEYNKVKTGLPCFTFNFQFIDYKNDDNIFAPTGFLYLDVDGETNIDLNNPFIFASWVSVSGNGRSVLVIVDGLTKENLKYNYKLIAEELGINADPYAAKPTQYCFHSYDEDLFQNDYALIWVCKEDKNTPNQYYPFIKEIDKDSTEMGTKKGIRFSNINNLDFKGEKYIYFEHEKEYISVVNVPKEIKKGTRNSILYSIAYQIKALNHEIEYLELSKIIHYVNKKRCKPILEIKEVEKIIKKVNKLDSPEPMLNEERRIIFNPEYNLSNKEKFKIINNLNGKKRIEQTIQQIKEVIDKWDIHQNGKVTQEKLAKVSKKDKKTIQKHYHRVKSDVVLKNIQAKELRS